MQNSQNKLKQNLADMQLWAADQMKHYANLTSDPQLKRLYEQVAALNRKFYEQFTVKNGTKNKKSNLETETEMLMRAYYCQRSLYTTLSQLMTDGMRPNGLDEVFDRQTMICRQILEEAQNRIALTDSGASE